MNNTHEESKRLLRMVKQLADGGADEELQAQVIENALKRAYLDGKLQATQESINRSEEMSWEKYHD